MARGAASGGRLTAGGAKQVFSAAETTGAKIRVSRQLRRIDADKLDDFSGSQKQRLGELLLRHGGAAERLIQELDAATVRRLAESDTDLDRVVRNYDGLSSTRQQRFVELLKDDDLGGSWLRVVGDEEIGPTAIRRVLNQIDRDIDSHNIQQFRTARRVNDQEFRDGLEDPYDPGTVIVEFATDTNERFVRVHHSGNKVGGFMMREREISGLTATEIKSK